MRIPIKSERDAFRLAYGGAVLIGLAVVLGALTEPLVGVALFVGVLIGVIAWDVRMRDPDRPTLRDAAGYAARAAADPRHCVLIVANQTVAGQELREEIMQRADRKPVLRVVAPVLPSRAHYIASDIDRELAEAQQRLDATLAWAREQGLEASGRVGDMTPLQAIEDELRTFPADELIISTHPKARSNWLESRVVERAREELDIPVSHVVVDLERQAARA